MLPFHIDSAHGATGRDGGGDGAIGGEGAEGVSAGGGGGRGEGDGPPPRLSGFGSVSVCQTKKTTRLQQKLRTLADGTVEMMQEEVQRGRGERRLDPKFGS